MEGWNKTKGEIKKYIPSEADLWSAANYFFSSSCRKTSTYQFGLLKSIMDSLFSGELTNRGIEIPYSVIFERFAENYWNLITKYHLVQMRNNGHGRSRLEAIICNIVSRNTIIADLEFTALSLRDKTLIVEEVSCGCKANPLGALYNNFDGMLYGFDLKDSGLWVNPAAYEFLLKYKFDLEKLNYYAWARFMEKINDENCLVKVLDKLEDATPQRKDLSIYRFILQKEFEINTCFYCGKKLSSGVEVDHVIPWKLVREDRIWNFVLACKECNRKKNDKVPNKGKLIQAISRNEMLMIHPVKEIAKEFDGYFAELMFKLWNYAKMGGYKEYNIVGR